MSTYVEGVALGNEFEAQWELLNLARTMEWLVPEKMLPVLSASIGNSLNIADFCVPMTTALSILRAS